MSQREHQKGDTSAHLSRRQLFGLAFAAGSVALASSGCKGGDKSSGAFGVADIKGLPTADYFRQVTSELSSFGYGTPQILIDLDRLEANVDAIVREIGSTRYRIVEKSLPSIDLLRHVHDRAGVDRFLVLHLPFLPAILTAFPTANVLVGKVQPIAAVQRLFAGLSGPAVADAAARVSFLVDSRVRLEELAAFATSISTPLSVGIEIDVGLHRSGVRHVDALPDVLAGFAAHPTKLRLFGMLGYDGHVPFAPAAPGMEAFAARKAYQAVEAIYQSFVEVVHSQFPALWRDDLVFNSGGTATYALHHGGVVNDVAAGGGVLRPASYPDYFIGNLQPAIFLAAPVLAHYDDVEIPFVSRESKALSDGQQSFSIYGGGWAAEFAWPANVSLAPLVSDPENLNLVPNQTLLTAPAAPAIVPGDWIVEYPRLADAIFQFENILLVRGGRLQKETWNAYPRRY